jgi:exodeoxyribonuclease VII small subunit
MAPAKKKAAKKSKKQRAAGGEAEVPFEQALAKLEEAVADLESGELGIDEALAKYEDGITQLRRCQQILKRAEQKVELLLRDAGGELTTAPAPDDRDDPGEDE